MIDMIQHRPRRFGIRAGSCVTAAVVVAALVGGMAACGQTANGPAAASIYDFPIEFYQGQEAVGGASVALSDLRGTPVALNFWAGLCPPCRAEMPEFQSFADEYAGRVLVVGVDLGPFFSLGGQAEAMQLLDELAVTYPAGFTDDASVVKEVGVLALPTTIFINADGSVHRKWQGVLSGDKLAEITEEMLAEPAQK